MKVKKEISVVCCVCGRTNKIPIRYFYDGYEGPFLCKFCKNILDIDIDNDLWARRDFQI